MFESLRHDISQARKINVGPGWWSQHLKVLIQLNFLPVVTYRTCHWVRNLRIPVLRHLLLVFATLLRGCSEVLTGVHISPHAQIGPGFVLHHVEGIYVGARKIGKNCVISTGVLVSNGRGRSIGDNVFFGAGAKITDTAAVGNNVIIAPNSLVIADVPDNVTVVGVPARIQIAGGNYAAQLIRSAAARAGSS
jgi:serine O-acetyltransferase